MPNSVTKAIRVVIPIFTIAVAGLMLTMWGLWTFAPDTAQGLFEVEALSAAGINALKSDMGGVLLTVGIFIVLGFLHKRQWFYAAAITSGSILINRVISLFVDGLSAQGIGATVLEVLAVGAFVVLARAHPTSQQTPNK